MMTHSADPYHFHGTSCRKKHFRLKLILFYLINSSRYVCFVSGFIYNLMIGDWRLLWFFATWICIQNRIQMDESRAKIFAGSPALDERNVKWGWIRNNALILIPSSSSRIVRGVRIPLPLCVVKKIRAKYPTEEIVGFKKRRVDW